MILPWIIYHYCMQINSFDLPSWFLVHSYINFPQISLHVALQFPISFYQKYWETLKLDIYRLFDSLYRQNTDIFRLNYTYITLIPKKTECKSVVEYRPISLENGIIKIISKGLANRLK